MSVIGPINVSTSAVYSGNRITVIYYVNDNANCTCQLDSGTPVNCKNC